MRRDSLFYKLFQQAPELFFALLPVASDTVAGYRFDSVAVKEAKFEIDGVFLPPEEPGIVYFCEVQFQKDELLYERLFAESSLYFYRNRDRFSDWRAVIIYPSRSIEQTDIEPYQDLLESDRVWRIYLSELGNIRQLPVPLSLLMLTVQTPKRMATEARYLVERVPRETPEAETRKFILEMAVTIVSYQLQHLSRKEIEAMLDTNLTSRDVRAFQECREEGALEVALKMVSRQLGHRFGTEVVDASRDRLQSLPVDALEDLGEALLDFTTPADLRAWLDRHQ